MVSWGQQGTHHRSTYDAPSKSAVIGLIANAMGADRTNRALVRALSSMRMVALTVRRGTLVTDYQTIGGDSQHEPPTGDGMETLAAKTGKKVASKGVQTWRDYLADADFVVVLEGDSELVELCADWLRRPQRMLYLGRKANLPSCPILVGIYDTEQEVMDYVWRTIVASGSYEDSGVWCVRDCDVADANDFLRDLPMEFGKGSVGYARRPVLAEMVPIPPEYLQ